MRICILGAGAIGGFMGARLALAGEDVSLVTLEPVLSAIKENGLTLVTADGSREVLKGLPVTDRPERTGRHDVVVLSVKAHQIESVAPAVPGLLHSEGVVVTVQNGIPWWYFQKHGGPFAGMNLQSLDPRGVCATNIDSDRVIGCVAYPAVEGVEPGVLQHVEGDRFPVGELDGRQTERVAAVAATLTAAGLRSRVLPNIRDEIWLKAWGALAFNPISALTRATMVDMCRCRETRDLAATMMQEASEIAHKLGVTFRHPIERRIAGAEAVGVHKTSMLQDVEAGRALEIEALVGVILELGRLTETQTPVISAVYACAKLLDRTLGRAGIPRDG